MDIGPTPANYSGVTGTNTYCLKVNPANEDGTVNLLKAWAATTVGGLCTGSADEDGSDNVTVATGYYQDDGLSVTAGAERTFDAGLLEFTAYLADTGQYMCFYHSSGEMERDTGATAGGMWEYGPSTFPFSSVGFFDHGTAKNSSVYGDDTGTVLWAHDIDGVANANIDEVDGVAIANIDEIDET